MVVVEALERLRTTMPFPLRGIDSDNGSEFINETLLAYCSRHEVEFTRSRPQRKNDQAWVEQKNGSVVRRPEPPRWIHVAAENGSVQRRRQRLKVMTTNHDLAKQIEDLVRRHIDALRITAAAAVARTFAAVPPDEPGRAGTPTRVARPRVKPSPKRAPEELVALGERFYAVLCRQPGLRR
jgi:hypothetical protein